MHFSAEETARVIAERRAHYEALEKLKRTRRRFLAIVLIFLAILLACASYILYWYLKMQPFSTG